MMPHLELLDVVNPNDPLDQQVPRNALGPMAACLASTLDQSKEVVATGFRQHMLDEAWQRLQEFNEFHGIKSSRVQDENLIYMALRDVLSKLGVGN